MKQSPQTARPAPVWARALLYTAGVALVLLPAAPVGTRLGWWPFAVGLQLLAAAALLGTLVLVIASVILIARRRHRPEEHRMLLLAVITAMLPAIIIDVQIARGLSVPVIHDVTTDTGDPPDFVSETIRAAPRVNALEYAGTDTARQQASAYPDLRALRSPLPPREAFLKAGRTAEELGWKIVLEDAAAMRLEAVDTSFWFGFKDDVSIRIRPLGSGSTIDLRSVSRVGRSDLGVNAARIRRFAAAFEARR